MQKLFSNFPNGRVGFALLMLRVTLGMTAIIQGAAYLSGYRTTPYSILTVALFLVLCGAFLIIGLMTPVVASVVFIGSLVIATSIIPAAGYNLPASLLCAVYITVTAAAVFLLGPGSISLDALMFGRREIIITGKPNPPGS